MVSAIKIDGFMSANHISATFWVISCPKRNFDGSRARYRRNHGEIADCGNIIGEIVAVLVNCEIGLMKLSRRIVNRENVIDEIVAEIVVAARCVKILSAYVRVAKEGGWHDEVPTVRVVRVSEYEGEVRHRSRTCVRQLKASVARILWGVRPLIAFCPVRDARSQSAFAASLGLDRKEEVRERQ